MNSAENYPVLQRCSDILLEVVNALFLQDKISSPIQFYCNG